MLVQRMARAHVVVAVDGSVFKRHPRMRRLMDAYIALLQPLPVTPAITYTIYFSSDHSCTYCQSDLSEHIVCHDLYRCGQGSRGPVFATFILFYLVNFENTGSSTRNRY